jgi:myosin heavy subunit
VLNIQTNKILQTNHPSYEKCADLADLTFLNDATLLHNIRERYYAWFIFVNNFKKFLF